MELTLSTMKCPNCLSENVRRSRRRGPKEGLALRVTHQAPYRCRECGLRFNHREDDGIDGASRRDLSLADYLGLRGAARRYCTDQVIYGALALLVFIVLVSVVFAFAFGWIEPPQFLLERDWSPKES